jgi:hypothetical protein
MLAGTVRSTALALVAAIVVAVVLTLASTWMGVYLLVIPGLAS